MRRLRVGARLRALLAGELRVYGLRAPARARWDGGWEIETEHTDDRARVLGVVAGAHGLAAFDLARRLWSGRLAELVGRQSLVGALDTVDHDLLVRLLGFRRRCELAFKRLEPGARAAAEDWAAGINAWIDGRGWSAEDTFWARHGSRPRLFGGADALLIGGGASLASRAAQRCAPHRLAAPIGARLRSLRAPEVAGLDRGHEIPVALRPPAASLPVIHAAVDGVAQLHEEEVLPGGDDHRLATADGWTRLSVRRAHLVVRGEDPARFSVRTAPRGPLISDLLADLFGPVATGPAASLGWEVAGAPPLDAAPCPPWAVGAVGARPATAALRLVPLTEGA